MSGRVGRLRERIRQRGHHRAFRIPAAPDPSLQEHVAGLLAFVERASDVTEDEQLLGPAPARDTASRPGGTGLANSGSDNQEHSLDETFLAEAVTNLWRAQRRLERAGKGAPPDVRHPARHLRTCAALLKEAGLEVLGYDGEPFREGRSLEVLTFQDGASLTEPTIVETVRPDIYLTGRRIQIAQVIVGKPSRDGPE